LGEANDEVDKLKQSNFLEINQLKRHMSSEHDKLVTGLHAQIRQLTLEREEALAQVSGKCVPLNFVYMHQNFMHPYFTLKVISLRQSLSETQEALKKAGKKECDGPVTSATQAEVDSLQVMYNLCVSVLFKSLIYKTEIAYIIITLFCRWSWRH